MITAQCCNSNAREGLGFTLLEKPQSVFVFFLIVSGLMSYDLIVM